MSGARRQVLAFSARAVAAGTVPTVIGWPEPDGGLAFGMIIEDDQVAEFLCICRLHPERVVPTFRAAHRLCMGMSPEEATALYLDELGEASAGALVEPDAA